MDADGRFPRYLVSRLTEQEIIENFASVLVGHMIVRTAGIDALVAFPRLVSHLRIDGRPQSSHVRNHIRGDEVLEYAVARPLRMVEILSTGKELFLGDVEIG